MDQQELWLRLAICKDPQTGAKYKATRFCQSELESFNPLENEVRLIETIKPDRFWKSKLDKMDSKPFRWVFKRPPKHNKLVMVYCLSDGKPPFVATAVYAISGTWGIANGWEVKQSDVIAWAELPNIE